ncbi:DMT family transporter [Roseibacterium sp. SDUM158017]|uniref:DMT family transporter n=1 Tax=Roseicyclus salinarum TaxID=3036773 RepID=UPI0024153E21|nr:DMT family transporter [Roseibacterium sp. SDUM158017]MDG4650334.1 DMT family transporter [Roseibacterium sp. SDUM158017]
MTAFAHGAAGNTGRAIAFILAGMLCISINDMLIKLLSGGYPLHQMVFVRSVLGLLASAVFLRLEGGISLLRTDRPGLHALRAGCIVLANMLFFLALSVMPLGAATALFFVAPLFITLLAIPVLGEPVGRQRLGAVLAGLAGVAVMMAPGVEWGGIPRWALSLPVLAAACYAGMQVLTRKLGVRSAASAMTFYIQVAFIAVSLGFYAIAGDGRFSEGLEPGPLVFLLRAWVRPEAGDLWIFGVLGALSAMIGYCLSQAYRLGTASVVASCEYVALPLAILWGWMIFDEVPQPAVWAGTALIAGSGLWVFARERARDRALASARPVRRD